MPIHRLFSQHRSPHVDCGRQPGFTLVEMLVVIAIVAILAMMVQPSFVSLMAAKRISTDGLNFMSDLAFMRNESVRRATTVTACSSSDGATCNAGSAWTSGRIIFSDANGNGVVDGSDQIIRVTPALNSSQTITVTGFSSNIQFTSTGTVQTAGTVKICNSAVAGSNGNSLTVLAGGLVHLSTGVTCP